MLDIQHGIMCKQCFEIIYKSGQTCRCGNCGIIIDTDGHTNIYVTDIRTTQRAYFFHTGDYQEVRRILLKPFAQAIYVPYHDIRNNPLYYRPPKEKNKYIRKTSTKYNQRLINALDKYKFSTSDGIEDFQRTVLNDPLKVT